MLRDYPGTGADSPAARIGVASWDQWFPALHEMSESFFTMQADFALGPGTGPARWVSRGLLGDYSFTPWHSFDATAVIDNAPLLTATSHWLRKGDHTHLIGTPMSRAGVDVPHPAPARPELVTGRPLGVAVGRGGEAKLPARLRIQG
ncbi:hypothetical protein [Arthrobacter zhaoguopingii]|uniref:hypothetical protein n=1 Tax=Arthrobacter zhaoguopingii TaxID=2681491 RepID=UPI00135BE774|nr:hypothetical protein [Arthrobacter zhaoguopingii]